MENQKISYCIRYSNANKLPNELPFQKEKYFRNTPKEENSVVLTLLLSKINDCIESKITLIYFLIPYKYQVVRDKETAHYTQQK